MFRILMILLMLTSNVYAANWDKAVPASGDNLTAWPTAATTNWGFLDTLLSNYRRGFTLGYSSGTTLTASAGEVTASNSGGTARIMLQNAASTNVTASNIDVGGSFSGSTTYYVYAGTSSISATSATLYISASSSAPSGVTYYKRLGNFTTTSGAAIANIVDDVENSYVGTPVSKSFETVYQAATDGFVTGYTTASANNPSMTAYTDSSNPPTTAVQSAQGTWASGAPNVIHPVSFPVRKGNYYKVTTTAGSGTLYFIPLGN